MASGIKPELLSLRKVRMVQTVGPEARTASSKVNLASLARNFSANAVAAWSYAAGSGPSRSRIKKFSGYARNSLWSQQPENRMSLTRHVVQGSIQDGMHHGPGVRQRESGTNAVAATTPTGVQQPDLGAVFRDPVREHPGIEHWRAEA